MSAEHASRPRPRSYTADDIRRALEALEVPRGAVVFMHSNIGFFGLLEGARSAHEHYQVWRQALIDVLGPQATLCFPCFSYSFTKGEAFDPRTTPGVGGLLAEAARQDPEAVRSLDANFSVCAIGPAARALTDHAPEYSFGPDSFWHRLLQAEGSIVNLNFDAGSTFIHYVERELRVPYRYDKAFEGELVLPDGRRPARFYHFVYDLAQPHHSADFGKLHRRALDTAAARVTPLARGTCLHITARATYDLIARTLPQEPAFLVQGEQL